MQKVSYMGDGVTTEFAFNFPYFENSNIIVNKNGATATGYNIVGTSAGLDADIPYTGGKVVFETAPTALDNITIARSLPLSRVVDYQPLAKIDPTTLNQDMNYMMEVLKDLQDELDGLAAQYSDIANKESTAVLLAEMAEIHSEIVAVAAQITALGDVSQIRSDITTLQGYDYVVESQSPTAENNYIWYRKYKSGWVEQGICAAASGGASVAVTLPVTMADTNYSVLLTQQNSDTSTNLFMLSFYNKTASGFTVNSRYAGSSVAREFVWQVCGIAA